MRNELDLLTNTNSVNSNKEKVGESSYWAELLGPFHLAELLYQCKLALRAFVAYDRVKPTCSEHRNNRVGK